MDDETRAAFGRMDRYFELAQAQHLELRQDIGEMRQDIRELRQDSAELKARLGGLEQELRAFRDWVATQFADLWAAIRQILARLDRLEQEWHRLS